MPTFYTRNRKDEHLLVMDLVGELDAHTAQSFEKKLEEQYKDGTYSIVLNLNELEYMSSSGLGVLMSWIYQFRDKGGDLKLAQLRPKVLQVFQLLGFDALFQVYDSEDLARKNFKAGTK